LHRHLGHYGASTLDVLKKSGVIQLTSGFSNDYISCHLAKSHRLPFTSAEHRMSSPLQLIHYDVWQSPVLGHNGYKYYVAFSDDNSCITWIYPT